MHTCVGDDTHNSGNVDVEDLTDLAQAAGAVTADPEAFIATDQTSHASTATIYKLPNGTHVAVTQIENYWQRGYALRAFSLAEYVALVNIQPLTDALRSRAVSATSVADEANPVEPGPVPPRAPSLGRQPNAAFLFGRDHPLANSHVQVLASKPNVPLFTGSVPTYPGARPKSKADKSAWQTKARAWARWALVLFRPWIDVSGQPSIPHDLSWAEFCRWTWSMRTPRACPPDGSMAVPLLCRVRLQWLYNAAHVMRVREADRLLQVRYRARAATVWASDRVEEAALLDESDWPGGLHGPDDDALDDARRDIDALLEEQHAASNSRTAKTLEAGELHAAACAEAFDKLFDPPGNQANPRAPVSVILDVTKERVENIEHALRAPPGPAPQPAASEESIGTSMCTRNECHEVHAYT